MNKKHSKSRSNSSEFQPQPQPQPQPLSLSDPIPDTTPDPANPNFRNGRPYPDPFPYDPPSPAECDALKLTPPQRIALEHMLLGSQLFIAARAAGVTRMTLYRWLHRDPNFQAAYNTWQTDAVMNSRTRTLAMLNTATTTVEAAAQTDPRIALAVLKASGILQHATPGPTEPEECQLQIDLHDQQSQQRSQSRSPSTILFASVAGYDHARKELPPANSLNPKTKPAPDSRQHDLQPQPAPHSAPAHPPTPHAPTPHAPPPHTPTPHNSTPNAQRPTPNPQPQMQNQPRNIS